MNTADAAQLSEEDKRLKNSIFKIDSSLDSVELCADIQHMVYSAEESYRCERILSVVWRKVKCSLFLNQNASL